MMCIWQKCQCQLAQGAGKRSSITEKFQEEDILKNEKG
jgi:hypothetical protein